MRKLLFQMTSLAGLMLGMGPGLRAQGTQEDYKRAYGLRQKFSQSHVF